MEVDKRKEIVSYFISKNILVDPELLAKLDSKEKIDNLYDFIKQRNSEDIASFGILKTAATANTQKSDTREPKNEKGINISQNTDEKSENPGNGKSRISREELLKKNPLEVTFAYQETEKKRDIQDFVCYFNARYKALRSILTQRQEMQNLVSISKIRGNTSKEKVAFVGMIIEKSETKNNNIMFKIEDPTGDIKILVNKNKPKLLEEAKDMVLDEVVGIMGTASDKIVFVDEIFLPEVPYSKEFKKYDEEVYVCVLSDFHVGNKQFLPNEMNKFLRWINQESGSDEQKNIASKVKYIFLLGDLVEGVGIYPVQEGDLSIPDIYKQYEECINLLKRIPQDKHIIICPGNHDALRLSEPQPRIGKEFVSKLWDMENVTLVTNPSTVNICKKEGFPGFDVLMYHGYSFDYYGDEVESIRLNRPNMSDRVDLIMKFLIQRRHLSPSHSATLYIPDIKEDPLVINKVPDFFLAGHEHKSAVLNYRNVTLICGSCWTSQTAFQEKVGHVPEPGAVPIINLQTRKVKVLKF